MQTQKMVERLSAERNRLSTPEFLEGRRLGRQWAEEQASLADLMRLEGFIAWKERSGNWAAMFPQPGNPAVALAGQLMGSGATNEMAASYFAKAGVSRPLDRTVEFWGSWCDGAAAAWRSVKDLL